MKIPGIAVLALSLSAASISAHGAARLVLWGKDSAIFMEEVLAWLIAGGTEK